MPLHRRMFLRSALGATIFSVTVHMDAGALVADTEPRPLPQDDLVGEYYAGVGRGKRAAVIMLNGSDGGIPAAPDAKDLAAAGYCTLALAYFKDWSGRPEGLPSSLNDIPLEYFFRAIAWLKRQPGVDPSRIVLVGQSRGAELALLLASLRSDIAGVVAFSPSSHVWQGIPAAGSQVQSVRPAWTLNDAPVPFQISSYDPALPMVQWFERAVPNAAARIRVENINGPLLLVSSKADTIWPASAYADEIAATLSARGGRFKCRNLKFENASHLLMGTGPGITKLEIPGMSAPFYFGGTPEATAAARAEAWRATKDFFAALAT